MSEEEEEREGNECDYCGGKEARSRSISLSSYESGSSGSEAHPRHKRGVDAILSAAEILHDNLPPSAPSKVRALFFLLSYAFLPPDS
jgi:hypothetical protein